MKKKFSLIFVICCLFIGTASAQWWVRGGNLLWPYGDVTVQKNLGVGINLTVNDSLFFIDDSTYLMNYRFYEDNELAENYLYLYTLDANYTNRLSFGYAGLYLRRDLTQYFAASPDALTAVNSVGTFAIASEVGLGSIKYTRTVGSVVTSIFFGPGDPEGNVSALPGSIYLSTDGGAQTTFFVKESGTGNTGWVGK